MENLTLDEVNTAIRAVLVNQSYEINGRKYVRADLSMLRVLRKELIDEDRNGSDTTTLKKGAYRVSFN